MELQSISFCFSNLNHMKRRCHLKYLICKIFRNIMKNDDKPRHICLRMFHFHYLSSNVEVPLSPSFHIFKPHLKEVKKKFPLFTQEIKILNSNHNNIGRLVYFVHLIVFLVNIKTKRLRGFFNLINNLIGRAF